MSFCTNCGAPTAADQRYCTVCGQAVVFATALTPAPVPREGEWRVKGEGARVAVGLAILAPSQSRWSVLLRLILALPLTLWVVLLALASAVGTVAAWFAALINGRVPVVLQGFLTDVLRYDAKISAYLGLLTHRWPGWSLRVRAGDQVSLEIAHVDLNRWSVLFRLVLAVPALVVSGVANVGGYLVSVVMWLCALALGRVPQPLHEARAQIWRFTIRASAFVGLLSPSQPFDDFFGQAATPAHEVDDATALSTRATLSSPGRAIFIVALLTGAYFQVQPGLVRWPLAYVVDRTMAPALVNAINRNIVDDLANYASNAATCTGTGLGACPVDAATAQVDVDRQRQLLHNFEQLMVQGRHEYFAYENEVLVIELTLEQAANSPASDEASYRAQVLREQSALAALYEDVRRAL